MSHIVLVIDDDEVLSHLIELGLTPMGNLMFRRALSGRQGLELAEADPPDVILLDYQMPVMDGLDTLKYLRANKRTARTPIVAITASDSSLPRCAEMIAACDAYLSKPFDWDVLRLTVQTLLTPRIVD